MTQLPRHLAVHEAGHAVAAIRLRLSLRYAGLDARAPHLGSTVWAPTSAGSPDRDRREAVCVYAGCEARLHDGASPNDILLVTETKQDFSKALAIGRRLVGEDELRSWVDECRGEARDLIAADWAAVQAVAEAILAHRKLRGSEVRAIVLGS